MNDHSNALLPYEKKTLEIQQQLLPSNYSHLNVCYNNITNVYDSMSNYIEAHLYYEHATENRQHSLPINHPHRQIYKENLERIKEKLLRYLLYKILENTLRLIL